MKYAREIKVGALATLCIFLLFFGFNYLKGVNIFSPTNSYHGTYDHLHGLEEQAAVYICGHKVGQVDAIHYDYTRDSAFTVDISIAKDIALPEGTRMALIADGLLGGMAIELQMPEQSSIAQSSIEHGSYLPTTYVHGIMESLQGELLAHIDHAVQRIDSLVAELAVQVEGDHVKNALQNVDRISGELNGASRNLNRLRSSIMQTPRLPTSMSSWRISVRRTWQAPSPAWIMPWTASMRSSPMYAPKRERSDN